MKYEYQERHTDQIPIDPLAMVHRKQTVATTFMGCTAIAFIYGIVAFILNNSALLASLLAPLLLIISGLFTLKKGNFFLSRVLLMATLNTSILILSFFPIPREVVPLLFFNLTLLSFIFFDKHEPRTRMIMAIAPMFLLSTVFLITPGQKVTTESLALSSTEKAISVALLGLNFGMLIYFLLIKESRTAHLKVHTYSLEQALTDSASAISQKDELIEKHQSNERRLQEENDEQQELLIQKEIELRKLTDEAERIRLQLAESKRASEHAFEKVGDLMEEAHLSSEMLQVQENVLKANLDIQKLTSEQVRIAHIEQQKFAAMVENSSDLIALFDFEGNFLYINKKGKQLIGLDSTSDATSPTLKTLFSNTATLLNDMEAQMESKGRWHGELSFINQHSGQPMVMDAAIFTVYDGNSEQPICRATVQRDITDKKKVETDLKRAYKELQASELKIRKNSDKLTLFNEQLQASKTELENALKREEQSKEQLSFALSELKGMQSQLVQAEKMASLGQLTAGIAHEINNPINFVFAGTETLTYSMQELMKIVEKYSELQPGKPIEPLLQEIEALKNEADFPELKEDIFGLIDDIMIGAVRTSEIVKGLRNFSRLDEHKTKLANVEDGIDSTLVLLKNQVKERITIHRQKGDIAPINCYPGQLNQVFMNILTNAVQAIQDEGNIWISTLTEGDEMVIKIKDDGIGMPEHVREKVFEPFFTTKDVGKGTGLGMSISYGIIQKHGGRITIESEMGKGSEFSIYLPIQLGNADD